MKKSLSLIVLSVIILLIHSCESDSFEVGNEILLKSNEAYDTLIEEAEEWYYANPEECNYSVMEFAKEIKWNKAMVHDVDTAIIIEVPVKLDKKYLTKVKDEDKKNVDTRLLFIKKEGVFSSLNEFIISEKSKEEIEQIEKANLTNYGNGFEGTVFCMNTCGDVVYVKKFTKNVSPGVEISLKSEQVSCIVIWEFFDDGSVEFVMVLGCWMDGDGDIGDGSAGGGGSTGSAIPGIPGTEECPCTVCNTCNKCLNDLLKSAPIPGDEGSDEVSYECPMCSCPAPAELFFQEVDKINLESPTLLQDISYLMRDLRLNGGNLIITNTFEGVGDNFLHGYNIAQKFYNYQGSIVEIDVIYDAESEAACMGNRTETHNGSVVFHEIFVKGEISPSGDKPNLIRMKFKNEDIGLYESVWKHVKGEANLWNCN